MDKEKQIVNSDNTGGVWDSLSDIPFRTGGGFKTKSGIILTGEVAREQMMKQLVPKTEAPKTEAPKAEAPKAEAPKAEVSQAEGVGVPAEAEPQVVAGPTGVAEIDAILNREEVKSEKSDGDGTDEVVAQEPSDKAVEVVEVAKQEPAEEEVAEITTQEPSDKAVKVVEFTARKVESEGETGDKKTEEVAFVQSTELGDKLQRDLNYFTYLVNAEHGFAVEKSKAVDTYIEKMEQAEGDKEVWQAMRMGRDILNGKSDFSDEEKQRVRDFMESPLGRKKELRYRISSAQKSLGGIEEGIKRSEEEYNRLNSKNIVDKFLNRWKIREARDRLEAIKRRRDGVLWSIKRQQAELQAIGEEQSELERVA